MLKTLLVALALVALFTPDVLAVPEDTKHTETVVPETAFPEDTHEADPHASPKVPSISAKNPSLTDWATQHPSLTDWVVRLPQVGSPTQDGISIDDLIHSRLKHLAKSTMPHQWDKILSDKDLPIASLLQLPMGKMSCAEARLGIDCDTTHPEKCELELEAIHKGSLGRTRWLKAHVLEVHGQDKMTLLVRGFREPNEDEKDTYQKIPFHQTVVDPVRDVVMEATQVNSDGKCQDFTVHHPSGGTAELAAIFEKDDRKGLTQMLKPLHKKMTQRLQESGLLKTSKRTDGTEEESLVSHQEAIKLPAITAAHERFTAAFKKAKTWEDAAKADEAFQKSVGETLSKVDEGDVTSIQTEKSAEVDQGDEATPTEELQSETDSRMQRPDNMRRRRTSDSRRRRTSTYCTSGPHCLTTEAYQIGVTEAKETMYVKGTGSCTSSRRRGVSSSNTKERLESGHSSCIACIEGIAGKNLRNQKINELAKTPVTYSQFQDTKGNGVPPRQTIRKCFKTVRTGRNQHKKAVDPKCVHCTCVSECTEFIEQCYESTAVKYLGCYQEHGWPYRETTVSRRLLGARKFGHMMEAYKGRKGSKEDCMKSCGDAYQYAGYGVWGMCYCGNSFGEPGKAYPKIPDSHCPDQKGGHHSNKGSLAVFQQADSSQLSNARQACQQEDDKEINCVEKSVLNFFKGKLCAGMTVCSLSEDAMMSAVIGVVVWIVDELIGCALGFWCQPSFWQGMSTQNGREHTAQVQGADAAKGASEAAAEEYMADSLEHRGMQKSYAKTASKELEGRAVEVAQNRGMKASTIRATKKFFSNMIPCLPLAILAWLEGGLSFFTCMGQCLLQALGATIVEMIFTLVKDCLWKYVEEALQSSCFPSDTQVHIEGGGTKQMQHVRVGDRVLTSNGLYSDVYVLSHEEPNVSLEYIHIRLDSNNTIEASSGHFIPVSPDCRGLTHHLRASAIQEGMCLVVPQEGFVRVGEVSRVIKRGMFSPFTLTGDIVVNGVVASSHSEWFLDGLADKFGLTHLLPNIYQAVLAPARGLYHLIGPAAARQELEEYQAQMALATESNWLVKPYLDLTWRALAVASGLK